MVSPDQNNSLQGSVRLAWLTSAEVDAQGTEGRSAGLLRCAAEYVPSPGNLELLKAGRNGCRFKLRFQQSTSDSPGPQFDVAFIRVRDSLLDQNVADLYPAFRFKDSVHLPEDGGFVRTEVHNAVRDGNVGPSIRDG